MSGRKDLIFAKQGIIFLFSVQRAVAFWHIFLFFELEQ
jgi:hypothetical protein